jgi:hypothetical protein
MAIIPNVKLNISYSLDSSTPQFVFTDVTDYGSYTGVIGTINVTSPSGVTSSGSITVDTSRINGGISIPMLSDSTPEIGMYSFNYSAVSGGDSGVYLKTFDFQYVKPKADITAVVDCLSPYLYTEDTTNYLVGSVTPSDRFIISSVDSINNTFSVSGEKSAFVRAGDTFSIISSSANNGDYTVLDVSYTELTNETVISVFNVADGTLGGTTLVTRKANIFYPQVLGLDPLVGDSKKLGTSVFYDKTHEFKYVTKGFYDYGDGVSVVDYFTDSTELDVQCDVRLCEVFCCINSVFKEYLGLKCRNKTLADIALEKYVLATSHLSALRQAFECGQSEAVDSLVSEIKKVTSCTDDCSCSDTKPTLITGLGSGGSISVVASGDNNINVASSVSGDTTTYTLTLSESILNDIANIGDTSVVESEDSSIIVESVTSAGVTTYDLSVAPPSDLVAPREFIAFNVEANFQDSVFTISDVVIQNKNNLNETSLTVEDGNSSSANWHQQVITVKDFQSTANSTYKAFVSNTYTEGENTAWVGIESSIRYWGVGSLVYDSCITEKNDGSFSFVISDQIRREIVSRGTASESILKFNIQIIE